MVLVVHVTGRSGDDDDLGGVRQAGAEGDEQRMMLMGLRRFTKYNNMPNVVALRETIAAKIVNENAYAF